MSIHITISINREWSLSWSSDNFTEELWYCVDPELPSSRGEDLQTKCLLELYGLKVKFILESSILSELCLTSMLIVRKLVDFFFTFVCCRLQPRNDNNCVLVGKDFFSGSWQSCR